MRPAAALIAVAALGALTAFALPRTGHAANPTLIATVGTGDAYTITLTDTYGNEVSSLPAGSYDIEVHDDSNFHNFHLKRPDGMSENSTPVVGAGTVTWTDVVLTAGTWTYQCDAHQATMTKTLTVTDGAPTTGSTTIGSTTAPSTSGPITTVLPPTTTAPPKTGPGEPCVVPKLVGRTLRAAKRRLALTACRLGRVTRAYSRRVARGQVISQRPKAGRRVGNGTAVRLVVSRGRRR